MTQRCGQCGAPAVNGEACGELFHEVMALEFSDMRAASVHFLTVACYQLQHPATYVLTNEATNALRKALQDVVAGDASIVEARDSMQRAFTGAQRVRREHPDAQPGTWPVTIADLFPLDATRHPDRVTDWARSVLEVMPAADR